MTISEGMALLNGNMVAVGAACLGLGAALGKIKGYAGRAWDWLNGTQGRQATKEFQALLAHAANLAEILNHPEPNEVRKTLDGIVAQLPGADPVPPSPPVGPKMAILALFLLASSAHAQYAASIGGLLGSSTWEVGDGGAWSAGGSTVAGGEINIASGTVDASGVFSPYFVVLAGAAGENHNGINYANALLGGGPVIPGTAGVPLILAADWRIFSGKQYPSVMLGTSFSFGKPFWVSK